MIFLCNFCAARIDDGDEGFEEDDWQRHTEESGEIPLRADRWWSDLGAEGGADPDQGRCLGIRCNIWARAQRRREITHHLRGGGTRNIGWGALRWQEMVGTDEVRFGKHRVLRYLPKKIANFLHEFRADDFPSLGLPLLPSDRSRLDVHAMLRPIDITRLLGRLKVILICSNM
jgi:hypothetical protein